MAKIENIEQLTAIIPGPGPKAGAKILDRLEEQAINFISRSPFLVMATTGDFGLELSPKGDDSGFVDIVDNKTLLIPERNGNQLALGLRNIIQNKKIGLIFFLPATNEVFRVLGTAELLDDRNLCQKLETRGKSAVLVIKVNIERAFFHCARSLKRGGLWNPESWGEPTRISIGKIISDAMGQPDLKDMIDDMSDKRNDELWI